MKKSFCDFCGEEIEQGQLKHDPIKYCNETVEDMFVCKKNIVGELFLNRRHEYKPVDCCKKCSGRISTFLFELGEKRESITDE